MQSTANVQLTGNIQPVILSLYNYFQAVRLYYRREVLQ